MNFNKIIPNKEINILSPSIGIVFILDKEIEYKLPIIDNVIYITLDEEINKIKDFNKLRKQLELKDLDIIDLSKNNLEKITIYSKEKSRYIKKGYETFPIILNKNLNQLVDEKYEVSSFIIDFLFFINGNRFYDKYKEVISKNGFHNISTGKFKIKKYSKEDTISKLNKLVNEKKIFSFKIKDEKFDEKNGDFSAKYNDGTLIKLHIDYDAGSVQYNSESIGKNEREAFTKTKAAWMNIESILSDIKYEVDTKKMKIPKKQIYAALAGFILLGFLLWYTFTIIIDGTSVIHSFELINKSWNSPWPYLLILDQFTTYITFIIVEAVFAKSFKGLKKKFWKRFININIMIMVRMYTGNFIFAVAVRTWVGNNLQPRENLEKPRVSSLVATIGAPLILMDIIRSLLVLPFLIEGTWQIYVFGLNGYDTGTIFPWWAIILSGWLGWLINSLHNFFVWSLFYFKGISSSLLSITMRMMSPFVSKNRYFKISNRLEHTLSNYQEQSKKSFRWNKKEFMHKGSFVGSLMIFTMFENMYAFNIISMHYGITLNDPTMIYGMERLVFFTKEYIPAPGGVGVIEPMMKSIYMGYFESYNIGIDDIELEKISEASTFVTRLFHSYSPAIVATFVGGGSIGYAFYQVSKFKSQITIK